MSRGSLARRRRPELVSEPGARWADDSRGDPLAEALGEEVERLDEERDRLREQVAEVEGWYRLLQADHAALRADADRSDRRAAELQSERDRLEDENRQLDVLVARLAEAGRAAGPREAEGNSNTMMRILTVVQAARRNKWAAAALLTIGALMARDPAVGRAIEAASARAKQALGRADEPADSGFVRFATMLNAREQADRAREQYNRVESSLKGDALLEAQDRLRTAKTRYRQARAAFLPELARRCELAAVPLPREVADALDALKAEARD